MPYIPEQQRYSLTSGNGFPPGSVGELNFTITNIIHTYLLETGVSYTRINDVIGVLECAKLELYRQIAVPYEDLKKKENGSVSDLDR